MTSQISDLWSGTSQKGEIEPLYIWGQEQSGDQCDWRECSRTVTGNGVSEVEGRDLTHIGAGNLLK